MLEEIKKISIFIVIAQMVLNLCAGKQYQKYVKLLISIMIMVQFLLPVLQLFRITNEEEFWSRVEKYEQEISRQVEEVSREYTGLVEEELRNLSVEEVKRQILETEAGKYINRLEYRMGRYRIILSEKGEYTQEEWKDYFATLLGENEKNVEVIFDADPS